MTSLFFDQWLYRWTNKGLVNVNAKEALQDTQTLGIYFSAAWCSKKCLWLLVVIHCYD